MNKTLLKKIALIAANIFFALFISGVILVAGLAAYYIKDAPSLTEEALAATTSSRFYDKDGAVIADLGAERRDNADTGEIPTTLANAIIAIEDQRFFSHRGVDIIRIAGSFLNNVRGGNLQGGSTLDQQLIKLTYFSTSVKDQTLRRKFQEIWLATQLESRYSKQEILTYYVNKVYMSNGNYGMKTAAKAYYGKELRQLTLPQVALLAGMPQAPNQYDPYTKPDAAKARRDLVLSEMLQEKFISKEDYQVAVDTPITDGLQSLKSESAYPAYMDNYLKQAIEEVEEKTGYNPLTTGMEVYTNVDSQAQQQLWNIYNTPDYVAYPDDQMQVASTVIDVTNGKVVAQLGNRHQVTNSSFGTNQAVETNRDFGSTMKPITDYAPGYESGAFHSTGDTLVDAPYQYPGTTIDVYNWDKQYYGTMTVKEAIRTSRNIPAIKALQKTGLKNAKEFLSSLGIDYPELHYSNAISSNTSQSGRKYGASSEKMAAAYAAFANGGRYFKPQYVRRIVFSDGTSTDYDNKGTQVMTKETAFMMTDMMKSVLTYGQGQNAVIPGVPSAGKTGTSNYSDDELQTIYQNHPEARYSSTIAPDENFVGYTPRYAMAVWTGYSNRLTPITDSGMSVATKVYRAMMTYLNPSGSLADWKAPQGLRYNGRYYSLPGYTAPVVEESSSQEIYIEESSSSTEDTSSSSTEGEEGSEEDTEPGLPSDEEEPEEPEEGTPVRRTN